MHTHTLPTPYREVEWEKASVCCAFAQLTPRKWLALVAFDQVFCSLATVLFENNALEKEHVGPDHLRQGIVRALQSGKMGEEELPWGSQGEERFTTCPANGEYKTYRTLRTFICSCLPMSDRELREHPSFDAHRCHFGSSRISSVFVGPFLTRLRQAMPRNGTVWQCADLGRWLSLMTPVVAMLVTLQGCMTSLPSLRSGGSGETTAPILQEKECERACRLAGYKHGGWCHGHSDAFQSTWCNCPKDVAYVPALKEQACVRSNCTTQTCSHRQAGYRCENSTLPYRCTFNNSGSWCAPSSWSYRMTVHREEGKEENNLCQVWNAAAEQQRFSNFSESNYDDHRMCVVMVEIAHACSVN